MWGFSRKDQSLIIKYFLIQRFFSILLFSFYFLQLIFFKQPLIIIFFSFIILSKLGTPPIFMWFINLCARANYKTLFLLCTLQKIIPTFILYTLISEIYQIWILITILVVIKGIHRLIHIKKIFAFSSIFNLVWIFLSFNNFNLIIIFFFIYMINLISLVYILLKNQKAELISDFYKLNFNSTITYNTFFNLLNIIGIPPFLGFLSKILIIENFIFFKPNLLTLTFILFTNIYIIFVYTRIFFLLNTLTLPLSAVKNHLVNFLNPNLIFLNWFCLILLL